MKAKTIKSHLRWKINDWLKTIQDENVAKLASKNIIVTGGSIVSMLTNEKVNDYDVYFRTVDAAKAVAEYYLAEFKKNPPSKHKTGVDAFYFMQVLDRLREKQAKDGTTGCSVDSTYLMTIIDRLF